MEGRSFDNSGIMEDIATGSAAGPIGASLYKNEIAGYSSTINQGSYLNFKVISFLQKKKERKKEVILPLSIN